MASRTAHVYEQIDSYLTGVLTPWDEQAFEAHLLCCGVCRAEADEASEVAVVLARVSPAALEELLQLTRSLPAGQNRLTVSAAPDGGGTELRAVVVGLLPGEAFDLLAIGTDGRSYAAARGIAAGNPQTIVGTVPLPPDRIWFYAVTRGRGDMLLVTVGE
jgi:hypothetical protein